MSFCSATALVASFVSATAAVAQPTTSIEPFTIFVFTTPRGEEAAKERMRLAVEDANEIVELSDWIELAEDRDHADIVIEIKAYALADDGSAHYIYTEADVLGDALVLVGGDERRRAERTRAVSDFMEKLQDYCAEHYLRLNAARATPPSPENRR